MQNRIKLLLLRMQKVGLARLALTIGKLMVDLKQIIYNQQGETFSRFVPCSGAKHLYRDGLNHPWEMLLIEGDETGIWVPTHQQLKLAEMTCAPSPVGPGDKKAVQRQLPYVGTWKGHSLPYRVMLNNHTFLCHHLICLL